MTASPGIGQEGSESVRPHTESPHGVPVLPLPDESGGEDAVTDQPINSLGEDDEDDEEADGSDDEGEDGGEGDEDEDAADARKAKGKGKGKATVTAQSGDGEAAASNGDSNQPWQAVWSAEQNAWYFWNTVTSEVTWTNPLEPSTSSSSEPTQPPLPPGPAPPEASTSSGAPDPGFGIPPDIDPELAHLLPPSQRGGPGASSGAQTALFNARTGRFTPADYSYSVDHLDEYNRSKRMNSHYFDVEAWERQRAEENAKRKREEAEGVGPKRVTKKDMQRFKKKAQEKKFRSQAWLRD